MNQCSCPNYPNYSKIKQYYVMRILRITYVFKLLLNNSLFMNIPMKLTIRLTIFHL